MTHKKNQRKTNGQAGPHSRANGHVPASTERGGVPVQGDQAASVDAGRASVAGAAGSTTAPGADCEAYAEVAPPPPNGHLHDVTNEPSEHGDQAEPIPGGKSPLPADAGEFVEEIHRRADLFIVWQELLNSKDDKIKQRAVERLTDLRYKSAAGLTEEPQRIVIDMPRPDEAASSPALVDRTLNCLVAHAAMVSRNSSN